MIASGRIRGSRAVRCALGVVAAALLAAGCGPRGPAATPAGEGFAAHASDSWVRVYEPRRAANGYTLAFYRRSVPILLDMNGRIVHAWPRLRVKSRLRLLPDGNLLTISLGRGVAEYDWEGNVVWRYDAAPRLPHHDVVRLANGNTLVLVLEGATGHDGLLEVDRQGGVVWEWSSADHLGPYFPEDWRKALPDAHINSLQELPENPHFDGGDERFRPGNLLVSARNLSTLFVIDRRSGAITWSYRGDLDYQHEAYMIPPGQPGHGRVLVYDNRFHDRRPVPGTRVLEIDPATAEVTWSFEEEGFYSDTSGAQQPLPNGNVLIVSSRGSRVFEVTRDGETVWSWNPPFQLNRPQRVAFDHTPQLAALSRPRQRAARPAPGWRHVDKGTYRFGRRYDRQRLQIGGKPRQVLKEPRLCRTVLLPEAPEVEIDYGVNRRAALRAGLRDYAARFVLTVRRQGEPDQPPVFEDRVDLDGDPWRHAMVPLDGYDYSAVELCVEIEEAEPRPEGSRTLAHWSPPRVRTRARPVDPGGPPPVELTTEEIEARKQHLEALGYVD